MTEAAIHRWERPERVGGSRAPAGQVAPRTLFGSVLRPRDEGSARWTRAALIALGLHVAALVGVSLATSSPSGPLESAGGGGGRWRCR